MKTDKEIAIDIINGMFHVSTISWDAINWFHEECKNGDKITGYTARRRLRKALNDLYSEGVCNRYYIGTSYYQTSDTLGGKSCLVWEKKY